MYIQHCQNEPFCISEFCTLSPFTNRYENCVFWGKLCPPNPPIGSGDRVQTRLIFTVFIVWWPWKWGQGHQNLILIIIPMIQYIKFGQNPSFGSRDRVQTSYFWSKFDIQSASVTLKWVQGHQKLIISFSCLSGVSRQDWSKSTPWFRRQSADKAHFYSFYSVVTEN